LLHRPVATALATGHNVQTKTSTRDKGGSTHLVPCGSGRANAGEMGTRLKRAAEQFGGWGARRRGRNIGGLAVLCANDLTRQYLLKQSSVPGPFLQKQACQLMGLPRKEGPGNYVETRGVCFVRAGDCGGQGMTYHARRTAACSGAGRSSRKRRRLAAEALGWAQTRLLRGRGTACVAK